MRGLLVCLALLLTGCCTTSRYVGVQITSTEPMSITRVMVNGDAVVMCQVGKKSEGI